MPWGKIIRIKVYYNILKKALRLLILPKSREKRGKDFSEKTYNKTWSNTEKWHEKIYNPEYMSLRGEVILARRIDYTRQSVEYLARHLSALSPSTVLELGSGNGIIMLSLAVLIPSISKWRGIEIASEGVLKAKERYANPPFEELEYITGLPKEIIADRLAKANVEFSVGDIHSLPFEKNSFDCIYSRLTIAQNPDTYLKIFKEAQRVSKKYTIFLEHFKEAQRNFIQRIHLRNTDFFRESFHCVEKAEIKPIRFEAMELARLDSQMGALIGIKKI